MTTPKYKHFSFEDRYIIQEFLSMGLSFSAISRRLAKDRTAVSREVLKHRFLRLGRNKHKLSYPSLKTLHISVTTAPVSSTVLLA